MSAQKAKVVSIDGEEFKTSEIEEGLEKLKDLLQKKDVDLDKIEEFKSIAYNLSLQRYLSQIEIFKSIEQEIKESLKSNAEVPKAILDTYRSLCKGADLLHRDLRVFLPSMSDDNGDTVEDVIKEVMDNETNEINMKGVLIFQIKEILRNIARLRKQLSIYDIKSIEYWKISNSYNQYLDKLVSLVKMLDKLNEGEKENDDENGLSIAELLETVKQIEKQKEQDLKVIEENWSKQQEEVKEE